MFFLDLTRFLGQARLRKRNEPNAPTPAARCCLRQTNPTRRLMSGKWRRVAIGPRRVGSAHHLKSLAAQEIGWWAEPTLRDDCLRQTNPARRLARVQTLRCRRAARPTPRPAQRGKGRGEERPRLPNEPNDRIRAAKPTAPTTKLRKSRSARNRPAALPGVFLRATLCQRTCHVREPSPRKNQTRGVVAIISPPSLAPLPANGPHTSERSIWVVSDTRRVSRDRFRYLRSGLVSLPKDSTRPREEGRRKAPKGGFREHSPQPPSRTIVRNGWSGRKITQDSPSFPMASRPANSWVV
jgi:hypothetical protein